MEKKQIGVLAVQGAFAEHIAMVRKLGAEAFEIRQLPDPPTAVFITNYHMSVGALTAVNQMKIRVPDDLSLAAFDDMELCSIVRPGLTAVRQPLKEMMKAACDILEKRVHGDYSDFPARVSLKATIVNRDSIKDRYGRK